MTVRDVVGEHNRERSMHAVIGLLVGIGSTLLIYLFVFWLSWVGAWYSSGLHDIRPLYLAIGVTGVFFLVSVVSAIRKIDPIKNVNLHISPEEALKRDVENALGLHVGVPIIRRDTLGWTGSILVGGPAAVLEAIADWRERLPTDQASIARWERLLNDARQGRPASSVERAEDIATLRRLGLVRGLFIDSAMHLALTEKGSRIG